MWCTWLWIPEGPGINGSRRHRFGRVSLDFSSCETYWIGTWVLVPSSTISSNLSTFLGTLVSQAAFASPLRRHKLGTQPGACSGPGGKLIVTDMDRIEAVGTCCQICHFVEGLSFCSLSFYIILSFTRYTRLYKIIQAYGALQAWTRTCVIRCLWLHFLLSIESKRKQFCSVQICLNLIMTLTHTVHPLQVSNLSRQFLFRQTDVGPGSHKSCSTRVLVRKHPDRRHFLDFFSACLSQL